MMAPWLPWLQETPQLARAVRGLAMSRPTPEWAEGAVRLLDAVHEGLVAHHGRVRALKALLPILDDWEPRLRDTAAWRRSVWPRMQDLAQLDPDELREGIEALLANMDRRAQGGGG